MGLFGKSVPAQSPGETPIGAVSDADLKRAAQLMERFNRSVGRDGELEALSADIYHAFGIGRGADLLRRPEDMDMPWRWLGAVASAAAERGQAMLTSRIFGCGYLWNVQIAPNLQPTDILDLLLPAVPGDILTRLAATALPSLLAMPGDAAILSNETGDLTAHGLALMASDQITDHGASSPAVPPEVASLAQDVLAGRAKHAAPAGQVSGIREAARASGSTPSTDKPVLDTAIAQMARVKAALTDLGFRFHDAGTFTVGAGVGIAFAETDYVAASISAGGAEDTLYLTSGVLKGVAGDQPADRLQIFQRCNHLTKSNSACPVFLHCADGWCDVLIQQSLVIDWVLADLRALRWFVERLPAMARAARQEFAEAGAGGRAYTWNEDDLGRLLIRSLT
jgi:hypothetical protein